jgi:hypothetical protein
MSGERAGQMMSPKREMSLPGNTVLRTCPVHWVAWKLGFCVDGNANPCGEFGEGCIRLSEVRELAAELTCADFANGVSYPHRIARRACRKWTYLGLLSFTGPSWRHLDTHNGRVLRLGATRLWNCWRKPRYVVVTISVLISNSSAAMRYCTDQRSISTNSKHHCTLWWSVRKRRLAGTLVFEFQKPSGVYDALCMHRIFNGESWSWHPNVVGDKHACYQALYGAQFCICI